MKRASDVLESAWANTELIRAARAQMALQQWPEVVGALLAEKIVPDFFRRGILFVKAESDVWAQEIQLRKETILSRLNTLCAEDVFKDIKMTHRKRKQTHETSDS